MAAIGAVLRAAPALTGGGAAAGAGLASGGGAASSALAGLNGEIATTAGNTEGLSSAFGDLKSQMSSAIGGTNAFGLAMGFLDDELNKAVAITNKYVKTFAPAEAEMFNNALKDLNAVIGEQLVPITRVARDIIRYFADALATFTPIVRGFIEDGIEKLRPAFQQLQRGFEAVLPKILPVVQLIGEVLVTALEQLLKPITWVIEKIADLGEALNDLLGLDAVKLGDSRGKAAASASVTNVQGVLSKAQSSAFGLGSESKTDKQISLLGQIYGFLEKLPEAMSAVIVEKFNASPMGQALIKLGQAKDAAANAAGTARAGAGVGLNALFNIPRIDQVF